MIIDRGTRFFQPIEEEPDLSHRGNYNSKKLEAAAAAVYPMMAAGGWISWDDFRAAVKPYRVGAETLAHYLRLAESDGGGFICLPTTGTPQRAPDEIKQEGAE